MNCYPIYLLFALFFILNLSFVSAIDATEEELNYCNSYFKDAVDTCISFVKSSSDFMENLSIMQERWEMNDKSVTMSLYMIYSREYYEEHMTLKSSPFSPGGATTAQPFTTKGPTEDDDNPTSNPEKKECTWLVNHPSFSSYYPGLEESIEATRMEYKIYVISGILDLMYVSFRNAIPTFDERLSDTMLSTILGDEATVEQVLEYIEDHGVCSKEDYEEEVAAGRGDDPTCYRFKIKSYRHIRGIDSCYLAESLSISPLFIEIAIDPRYLQLYSNTASQPIRYSYTRFTFAGVLTGYNYDTDYPYWIISIRRHEGESNEVRVKMNVANLFGNMGNKMYEVQSDVADYLLNRFNQVRSKICTVEELHAMSINTTHLNVLDYCLNDIVIAFNLNGYPRLQYVEVGHHSLRQSPALILNGLQHVVSLIINHDSFTSTTSAEVPNTVFSKNKKVILKNLPMLRQFSAGENAFADFIQLSLTSLPSLQMLSFGSVSTNASSYSNSFYWATKFEICDLPNLKAITVGNYGFSGVDFLTLRNLPSLETLLFGYGAFYGYSSTCSVDAVITLDNLLLLSKITIYKDAMNMFKEIAIRNVPSASTIIFDKATWDCLNALRIHGSVEANAQLVTAFCSSNGNLGVFVNDGNALSCESALQMQ